MEEQNNLDRFVSELIAAKGQSDDGTTHASVLAMVNDKINRALLEALPGNKLDAIESSVDDGTATEESVTNILENADINAEEIITNALEEFRDEYLGGDEQ